MTSTPALPLGTEATAMPTPTHPPSIAKETVEAANETTLGLVTWHSSGEDEGPDVGLQLGLGSGRSLWLGEMPKASLVDEGVDLKRFPDGWWFASYEASSSPIIAAVADQEAARAFFDEISAMASRLQVALAALEAAEARVKHLEQGIREAQDSLRFNQDDVIWFGGASLETLWEHLEAVRDPDGIDPGCPEDDRSTPNAAPVPPLPADVVALVIAAREVFDVFMPEDEEETDRAQALDAALEPFASRVPYENEPDQPQEEA